MKHDRETRINRIHFGSRRDFLLAGSSVAMTAVTATAQPDINMNLGSKRIDVHGHIPPEGLSAAQILTLMDYASISKMVIMPRGPQDEEVMAIYRSAPERIIPFLGTTTAAWHRSDYKVLRAAERALNTGVYKGVGELMLRYFSNHKRGEPEINRAADSGFILDLADICAAKNCVIQLHMEPENESIESLERLLAQKPKTNFIWAHFGSVANIKSQDHIQKFVSDSSPFYLDQMLRSYPNLYTDLSGIQGTNHIYTRGPNRRRYIPLLDNKGQIFPKFFECIRRNPNQVMWGLDTPYIENWSKKTFKLWLNWADNLLAQFSDQELRSKIMYKNAEKLMAL